MEFEFWNSISNHVHSLKTIEGLAVDDEIRDEIKFATKNKIVSIYFPIRFKNNEAENS